MSPFTHNHRPPERTATHVTASSTDESTPRRKKGKLRSAWISFAGRIVAQIIGAVATVLLCLILVQRYMAPGTVQRPALDPGTSSVAATDRLSAGMALAVLPLLNFSNDPQQEYVADGMTEALIAEVARIERLRVISRTSSMHYKDQRRRLPEIARVRITAQLIDAQTDEHVWSHSYDRAYEDVMSLQEEVARDRRGRAGSRRVAERSRARVQIAVGNSSRSHRCRMSRNVVSC